MVVYKDVGSGYPLSVQLAPYGFTPARIGNGEVQAVFVQVVPETSGNDVPQRIREVVRHHFGFAGSAAGEVHQRNIVVAVGMLRSCERGGIGNAFVEVLKTFGYLRAYADQLLTLGESGMAAVMWSVMTLSPAQTIILMSVALQRYTISFLVSRCVAGITTAPSLCSAMMLNQNS